MEREIQKERTPSISTFEKINTARDDPAVVVKIFGQHADSGNPRIGAQPVTPFLNMRSLLQPLKVIIDEAVAEILEPFIGIERLKTKRQALWEEVPLSHAMRLISRTGQHLSECVLILPRHLITIA